MSGPARPVDTERRRFTHALLGGGLALAAGAATAQDAYPSRTVKIVAPYPPGGTVDALARAFAQAYSAGTGGNFIVDNKAGAGGNIGLAAVAKSPADGYTLGLVAANMLATNRWLYKSLPFDPDKDFQPVAFLGRVPFVLVVNNNVPVTNLQELVALMKSRKTEFNYGSSGVGNTAHLFGEMFRTQANVEMVHVPYRSSGETLQELMAGRLQLLFTTPTELMPLVARNAVRPIAVAGQKRLAGLPGVPTLGELGMPGFETPTWFGIIAPAGTPKEIVELLHVQTQRAVARPEVKERLDRVGASPEDMTPEQFRRFIAEEAKRWEQIVKRSGARVE